VCAGVCVCVGTRTNSLPCSPQGKGNVLSSGRTVQMSPEESFELEGVPQKSPSPSAGLS